MNLLAGVSENEEVFTLGGLANVIRNHSAGFQLAGLANYVGKEGHGVLFSGLTNWVGGRYTGFQLAGLFNRSGDFSGLQVAGLVNIAGKVSGVQLAGLVNIADFSDYPIGLVNIIKQGEMGIAAGYSETGTVSVTFRSGGKVTYGIVGAGYNPKADGGAFAVLGGLGVHIGITPWLRINTELTGETLSKFSGKNTYKAGLALLPAFRIGRRFEIYGGPAVNFMQSDNPAHRNLFPGRSLWKKECSSRMQQLYIGYQAGIQIIL